MVICLFKILHNTEETELCYISNPVTAIFNQLLKPCFWLKSILFLKGNFIIPLHSVSQTSSVLYWDCFVCPKQSIIFHIPVLFPFLKWEYNESKCPLCSFMQEGFPERKHTQHPLVMILRSLLTQSILWFCGFTVCHNGFNI